MNVLRQVIRKSNAEKVNALIVAFYVNVTHFSGKVSLKMKYASSVGLYECCNYIYGGRGPVQYKVIQKNYLFDSCCISLLESAYQ